MTKKFNANLRNVLNVELMQCLGLLIFHVQIFLLVKIGLEFNKKINNKEINNKGVKIYIILFLSFMNLDGTKMKIQTKKKENKIFMMGTNIKVKLMLIVRSGLNNLILLVMNI